MKAKLTVTCNNQTKAYALPEQGVKIGRDPGQCQLALQDPDVSSLHAFMCARTAHGCSRTSGPRTARTSTGTR